MPTQYTTEERFLLERLALGPQPDHDTIPDRVLVNTGMAQRVPPGMLEITDAGRIWRKLPDVGDELKASRRDVMNFDQFKNCDPATTMFRKMGLADYLKAAQSWRQLRAMIVQFNDPDRGHFVKIAKQCDGTCSSGERILLHAIMYVCDFAWLADKLGGKKVWQNMNRAGGEFQEAVAACIAARV